MNILSWILFGLIAGALAKFIMPGKDPGGCLVTAGIGILGAIVGGFIGTEVFDFGTVTGFNLRSLLIAILGAVLLLAVYRLLFRSRRH
ncbi:MAG: GlsB/YeaQ/YmgE family stress response membrane protein [Longimicrobiales bacterium]